MTFTQEKALIKRSKASIIYQKSPRDQDPPKWSQVSLKQLRRRLGIYSTDISGKIVIMKKGGIVTDPIYLYRAIRRDRDDL